MYLGSAITSRVPVGTPTELMSYTTVVKRCELNGQEVISNQWTIFSKKRLQEEKAARKVGRSKMENQYFLDVFAYFIEVLAKNSKKQSRYLANLIEKCIFAFGNHIEKCGF